jgi:nitrogen regulatory protein PII
MTISHVKGFGKQKGHVEFYRGAEFDVAFVPKVKIEMFVSDAVASKVVETITEKARSGKIGDGKIFVSAVEQAVRIRTGETGDPAL